MFRCVFGLSNNNIKNLSVLIDISNLTYI